MAKRAFEFTGISSEGLQMDKVQSLLYFLLELDWKGFQLFVQQELFFTIANLIGKLMKIDELTANLSRPSVARICLEIDLLKPLPKRIWIGTGSNTGFGRVLCMRLCLLFHFFQED